MQYILVVDDDHFANMLVQFVLTNEGYEVETMDNPRSALHLIRKREPDLLLLDVAMPNLNGFEFSAQLRAAGYETPLIFTTAQDAPAIRLQGFKLGADDYICKPYNHQELVARIQAILRRVQKDGKISNHCIRSGRFELFPMDLKVIVGSRGPIMLTPTETHILSILMRYPGQVVDREQLLAEVWNDEENSSNILDVYIRRLRSKIEVDVESPRYIISLRNRGYKFIGQ